MKYKHQHTIDTFLEMVQVDSPYYYEYPMVDYLVNYMDKHNWQCTKHIQHISPSQLIDEYRATVSDEALATNTAQLVVTLPATDTSRDSILLCAHIDTVNPGRGVVPIVNHEQGIITSSGDTVLGSDDKSGVSSIIGAVQYILDNNLPHGKITLLFPAMEEISHLGVKLLDYSLIDCQYGYVFDTMGRIGRIMTRAQHGKVLTVTVNVKDIPNHTYACTVDNSLTVANSIISQLDNRLLDYDSMTFGQTISLNNSYQPGYMAPDCTTFKYVIRSYDKASVDNLLAKAHRAITNHIGDSTSISVVETPQYTLGYNMDTMPMGNTMVSNAKSVLTEMGIEPEIITHGLGNHDTSILARNGVYTLVLSCGMQDIHTTHEWVSMQDLNDCTELIIRLVAKA